LVISNGAIRRCAAVSYVPEKVIFRDIYVQNQRSCNIWRIKNQLDVTCYFYFSS